LLRHETLHVSGSYSAHHQEFIHCTLGTGICHIDWKTAFEQDQDGSSTLVLLESCLQTCMSYTSTECTVNKLLMMGRVTAQTCRVSRRSKFAKLVHLVCFIIKKFVTMHGHMNVKKKCPKMFASSGITLVLLHLCPRAGVHLSESSLWRCYLSRHNHSPFTRCREKQIQSIYRLTIEC